MILVTLSDNDKYFLKTIALIDKENSKITINMDEENIDRILSVLPPKWKTSTIVRLDKLEDLVILGGDIVSRK